jgi:hypothetical protein
MVAQTVFAVTRSFQGKATFDTFDKEKFEKGLCRPIKKLLATAPPEFGGIAVISCGEPGSKYAEEVRDGITPTMHYLSKAFINEIADGIVVPQLCTNWGLNPGSGTAINEGLAIANENKADKLLVWSPEIDLSGHMLTEMLNHMDQHALSLVGYMRNRWYLRLQWTFAQNTCAVWDINLLNSVGGMNPSCNGDGVTTVATPEYGDVPLAGMEDMEAYFRASAELGEFVRWGAVGMRHPAIWSLALKVPGTQEHDDNLKKIARQGLVMDEYAKHIFPDREPIDVYDQMMQVASLS